MNFAETQEMTIKEGLEPTVDEWAAGLVTVIENNKAILDKLGEDWIYDDKK